MTPMSFETARLSLRPWTLQDTDAFADMNADPQVMAHFLKTLSRDESRTMMERINDHFEKHGFGFWAVEHKADAKVIGMVGCAWFELDTHFAPAVEIGWRLLPSYWGQGYAVEAARACIDRIFDAGIVDQIVSFTSIGNKSSRIVMDKLGMTYDASDNFDHPRVPEGHPLRQHVLYRINKKDPL